MQRRLVAIHAKSFKRERRHAEWIHFRAARGVPVPPHRSRIHQSAEMPFGFRSIAGESIRPSQKNRVLTIGTASTIMRVKNRVVLPYEERNVYLEFGTELTVESARITRAYFQKDLC